MLIAAVFLTGCRSDAGTVASSMLERGFVAPPDSVKISTYWYWISGNVSKEGVAEDLRSMKAAAPISATSVTTTFLTGRSS